MHMTAYVMGNDQVRSRIPVADDELLNSPIASRRYLLLLVLLLPMAPGSSPHPSGCSNNA